MQEAVKGVFVAPAVKRYIVSLARQTRDHPEVYLGASPRGSLALYRTAQARAAMLGRDYVLPDDIKLLAIPTLALAGLLWIALPYFTGWLHGSVIHQGSSLFVLILTATLLYGFILHTCKLSEMNVFTDIIRRKFFT